MAKTHQFFKNKEYSYFIAMRNRIIMLLVFSHIRLDSISGICLGISNEDI